MGGGAEKIYFSEISSPKTAYEEAKDNYIKNKLSIRISSKNVGPGAIQRGYIVVVSKGEDVGNYIISANPQGIICSNLSTTTIKVTK